jgi:hypothetical protein
VVLGFELNGYPLSHATSPFCDAYFQNRVLWTICLGWLWMAILLIAASWVVRIAGVSHWYPAQIYKHLKCNIRRADDNEKTKNSTLGGNQTISNRAGSSLWPSNEFLYTVYMYLCVHTYVYMKLTHMYRGMNKEVCWNVVCHQNQKKQFLECCIICYHYYKLK